MRELVYFVATTLDGFIAREDGSFDEFPSDDDFIADLLATYPETFPGPFRDPPISRSGNRRFDAVLMGRKTYEVGLSQGITNPYPTLDQYVFSHSLAASPDPSVNLVSQGAIDVVERLKDEAGLSIWLCGGSDLATQLLEARLIDEVVVKLNPVLFGAGIPLFARSVEALPLNLLEYRSYDSGHMRIHYEVTQ